MTPNEHLIEAARHLAAALESVVEPPKPKFPENPIKLKPWCGKCSDHEHREVRNPDAQAAPVRCPDCHPFPNPKPSVWPCRYCGVPVHYGSTGRGNNGWVDEERSPGCAYSPMEFTHQPLR